MLGRISDKRRIVNLEIQLNVRYSALDIRLAEHLWPDIEFDIRPDQKLMLYGLFVANKIKEIKKKFVIIYN